MAIKERNPFGRSDLSDIEIVDLEGIYYRPEDKRGSGKANC